MKLAHIVCQNIYPPFPFPSVGRVAPAHRERGEQGELHGRAHSAQVAQVRVRAQGPRRQGDQLRLISTSTHIQFTVLSSYACYCYCYCDYCLLSNPYRIYYEHSEYIILSLNKRL